MLHLVCMLVCQFIVDERMQKTIQHEQQSSQWLQLAMAFEQKERANVQHMQQHCQRIATRNAQDSEYTAKRLVALQTVTLDTSNAIVQLQQESDESVAESKLVNAITDKRHAQIDKFIESESYVFVVMHCSNASDCLMKAKLQSNTWIILCPSSAVRIMSSLQSILTVIFKPKLSKQGTR